MCDINPTTTTTPEPTTTTTPTPEPTTTPKPDTTTTPSDNECTEDLEVLPMPGDCHKYYLCVATDDNGHFDILVRFLHK